VSFRVDESTSGLRTDPGAKPRSRDAVARLIEQFNEWIISPFSRRAKVLRRSARVAVDFVHRAPRS